VNLARRTTRGSAPTPWSGTASCPAGSPPGSGPRASCGPC
jgi:hypothetical protein